jgi:hypothetical protein
METMRVDNALALFSDAVQQVCDLPEDDYAIALLLDSSGFRGDHKRGSCALGNYVRERIKPYPMSDVHIEIDDLGLFLEVDGVSLIWDLPEHVTEFVVAYDRGLYPWLLTETKVAA